MIATTTILNNETLNHITSLQIDLIDKVIDKNLDYLLASLAVLGLAGVFFYIFNFKPLEDKIKKQGEDSIKTEQEHKDKIEVLFQNIKKSGEKNEKDIKQLEEEIKNNFQELSNSHTKELKETKKTLKDETELIIGDIKEKNQKEINKLIEEIKLSSELTTENLNQLAEKIDEKIKKEVFNLREKSRELELDTLWNEHYMWRARGTSINVIMTLIEYLEKGHEYNIKYLFELCLERLEEELSNVEPNKLRKEYQRLLAILSKIENFKEKISRIKDKVNKIIDKTSTSK